VATQASESSQPQAAEAEELTLDGVSVRLIDIPLDETGNPARPPRSFGRRTGSAFGGGPDANMAISEAPKALFLFPWENRRLVATDMKRTIQGVETTLVEVYGGAGTGEVWIDPSTDQPLLTRLYPTGGSYPMVEVLFVRTSNSITVRHVVMEAIAKRSILADRVRRITFRY
jgi:hypothetical protein